MAQLPQAFDANQWDPTQSAGQLPIGKQPVVIKSSDVKAARSNENNGYIQFNLEVIDGPNKGATGPYRINLYNSNQQTVEIAHRQMSALSYVTGVFNVQNTEQLHDIPFIADVQPQKKEPQYTEVKKVYDINGNEPGKQGQQAAQPQAAPAPQQAAPQQQQQQAPAANAGWGNVPQQQTTQPAAPEGQQAGGAAPAWGNQQQQAPQQQQPPAQQQNWQPGNAGSEGTNPPWVNS